MSVPEPGDGAHDGPDVDPRDPREPREPLDPTVDYQTVRYPYRRHPDQDAAEPVRHAVVVVGAGPVGLSLAIDLALQDVPVVLLDSDGRLSTGSRALCFAQRTLEIFDRLGCGQRMVDRGVSWQVGRVFFRDRQVYQFDLQPDGGHQRPAFINLQQYYVEGFLVERAQQLPGLDLRWHHELVDIEPHDDHVVATIRTPDGDYRLVAHHLVACDGARSTVRRLAGLDTHGRRFDDRFLIADVRMDAPFPAERWFWFDPPFHPGRSVLLHRQPDGVWRIDFQLGRDADPALEKQPDRILPRVRTMMAQASLAAGGDGRVPEIQLVWASVYTFACQRMDRFREGRLLFAGDAAHGVSPFGARGANSGVQDAENLAWKLAAVVRGQAPDTLLDSYARERERAADENILNSSRSTDFITPRSDVSRCFRDAVLDLARDFDFARRLVNSGRLSVPTVLTGSTLNSADRADADHSDDRFDGGLPPGGVASDAPIRIHGRDDWLLRQTLPGRFTALVFAGADGAEAAALDAVVTAIRQGFDGRPAPTLLVVDGVRVPSVATAIEDTQGLLRRRHDARPGTVVLLRPDQHVCARWRRVDADAVRDAVRRATASAEAHVEFEVAIESTSCR